MQPVRAKKHLGQHFLNDLRIAGNIVAAHLEKSEFKVLEIGPGTGVLTQFLITNNCDFKALDVDREAIAYLKKTYPDHSEKFLETDVLRADLRDLCGNNFTVLGNFPYNISSQIMFRVLEYRNHVNLVTGMFQKEVAERLATGPGSKQYGILSVLLQTYYDIEYLFTVHENSFTPPPKVKSAVIRLTRNERQRLECDEVLFKNVVKTTFNQRRKTIRNSIKSIFNGKDIAHPLLDKRPEQLSVEQFIELTLLAGSSAETI